MPVEVAVAAPAAAEVPASVPAAADQHKGPQPAQHGNEATAAKAAPLDDTDSDSSASARIKSYAYSPTQSMVEQKVADARREAVRVSTWRHDVFNLFALGAINAMNVWFIVSGRGAPLTSTGHPEFAQYTFCARLLS